MSMRNETPYRRLPGSSPLAAAGVYLGKTHVLTLDSRATRMIARRYYYGDIQAIHCRKTHAQSVALAVLAAAIAAIWVGLIVYGGLPTLGGAMRAAALSLPFLFALLYNFIKGPACRCTIRTAAGEDRLPGLRRYRSALRAIDLIHERVVAEQGPLSGDVLLAAPPAKAAIPNVNKRHGWALAFFGISLIAGAIYFVDVFYSADWKDGVDMILHGFLMILAPAVLAVGPGRVPGAVRHLTLAMTAYTIVEIPVIIAGMTIAMMLGGDLTVLETPAAATPEDGLTFYIIRADILLTSSVLVAGGASGLFALGRTPRPEMRRATTAML